MALLNSARYQQKLRRYHDKHVHKRDLNVGDLVIRRQQNNQGRHKLTPPWEGPYVVAEVLKPRTYKLVDEKGGGLHQRMEHQTATSLLPLELQDFIFHTHLVPLRLYE